MHCTHCGTKVVEDSKFCASCGRAIDGEVSAQKMAEKDLAGLGGWLVLVGIGLVVATFVNVYTVIGDVGLFTDGTVEAVAAVHGYAGTLVFEMVTSALLAAAGVYLLTLFFKKRKEFPSYYIYFFGTAVLTQFICLAMLGSLDYSLLDAEGTMQEVIDEGYADLAKSLASFVIWGLYMKSSKRVKLTFIQ